MDNLDKNSEMHTALGITEGQKKKVSQVENEEAPVFNRRGRKGAAQAAQSLGQRNSKVGSSSQSEVYRVVISKDSNEALESALQRCSEGFDTGTITKSDIANYIFQNLNKFFQDSDVKNLRAAHFDEKKVLGTLLRTEDDLPEDLKRAIRAHYGLTDREKKRTNRTTSDLSTEASVDNPSAKNSAA